MERLKSSKLQYELLKNLSLSSTIYEMLYQIVERVADVLKASACSIYIVDQGYDRATQRVGTGYQQPFDCKASCKIVAGDQVPDYPSEEEKLGITGWIISTGKSFLAQSTKELESHPHWLGRYNSEQQLVHGRKIGTFLGVPLRGMKGDVIGLIKVERCESTNKNVKPFSVNDQLTLETVARVASKCMMHMGELSATDDLDSTVTAWARDIIAEASATEGELDDFLRITVNAVASAMRADSCGIYLIDESGKTLTQRAGIGSQTPRTVIRSYLLPKQDQIDNKKRIGVTAWIASTKQSFYARNIDELRAHPHHKGEYDPHNFPLGKNTICGAFLGVPLMIGGTVIGVIKVENISKVGEIDLREFSKEAQRRFDLLAQDIAIAIMSLQGISSTRYQIISDAQKTIVEILQSGMDIPQLVEKAVKETANLFNARACALFLKEGNRLIQPKWAAFGWALKGQEIRDYKLVDLKDIVENPASEKEKVGLTVWIAVKQQKFYASSNLELIMHPHHKGTYDKLNFEKGQQCESFMGVPLIIGDKLIGVLKVETKTKVSPAGEEFTYFSDQDKLVFDLIANSIAIAIENARLLESQRLAEKIKNKQKKLISILHDFFKENEHAASTLYQAADLIGSSAPNTTKIIRHYAELLNANCSIEHLKGLYTSFESLEEFYDESSAVSLLYRFLVTSLEIPIETDSLDKIISTCHTKYLNDTSLLDPQFSFSETASILRIMVNNIAESLDSKGKTAVALAEVKEQLKIAESKAKQVPNPEKDLICRIIDQWLRIIDRAGKVFHYVNNPYITGVPVDPSAGSPFFGRTDILNWVATNLYGANQKNILILYGERRVGKTSILLQLERGEIGKQFREKEDRQLCPVHIDLQGLNDKGTYLFLYEIAGKICRRVNMHPQAFSKICVPSERIFKKKPYKTFKDFLKTVKKTLDNVLIVLMFDEFEVLEKRVANGKVDSDIYEHLRHIMQFCPNITFILAGTRRTDYLSPDYRKMFSNMALTQEVSFMDAADARDLIQLPVAGQVTIENGAIDELMRATHNHPYLLQLLCNHLIVEMNHKAKSNIISLENVNDAIEHFVEHGEFTNLWEETTDTEKMIFSALSKIIKPENSYSSMSEISRSLNLPNERISEALDGLLRHHLVERLTVQESDEKDIFVKPTIDLFYRWIQRNYSQYEVLN